MLNEKVAQLLNEQVNAELYSAYLYLHFANFYVEQGLDGFANWYQIQAQNNDAKVTYEEIKKPNVPLNANADALVAGLAHERHVTALINNIYEAAHSEKDFRTMQFLDWFIKEQGEEETNASDLIKKLELFGSDPKSLYMLNQELASRTYSAPSLTL